MPIAFDDFSDITNLTLNGTSNAITSADGAIVRLTEAENSNEGSVFSSMPLPVWGFNTEFQFRITDPGGPLWDCNAEPGADGLAFVIQGTGSEAIGSSGLGIGYHGIQGAVAVEFDTWCNPPSNDPDSNHVAITLDGSSVHGASQTYTSFVSPRFDNGELWTAWIDYDGSSLEVRANTSGIRSEEPILAREVEMVFNPAYVGFTSTTGADVGAHDLVSWHFTSAPEPSCIVPRNGLIGDLDEDGAVQFTDFLIISRNFGSIGEDLQYQDGDMDCDGQVDFVDFLMFVQNFGDTAEAASVPEPVGGIRFLLLPVLLLGGYRRRRPQTR